MSKTCVALAFGLILTWSAAIASDHGLNLSLAVDIVGRFKGSESVVSSAKDKIEVREAEVSLTGPIDHLFDGVLSLAAHQERGMSHFEVHEAYVKSHKLLPRSRFKLGQFALGIGRLNRQHRHEWPMIQAPKTNQEFFGPECLFDTGLEASVLVPTNFFLDVTVGASNGWTHGHTHNEGKKPKRPNFYTRIATYTPLLFSEGTEWGLSALSRRPGDESPTAIEYLGFDFLSKSRQGSTLLWLAQLEIWYRSNTTTEVESQKKNLDRQVGGYFLLQKGFNQHSLLGVLAGHHSRIGLKDFFEQPIKDEASEVSLIFTYKPSEFSTWRLQPVWHMIETGRELTQAEKKPYLDINLQFAMVLGAHPAHDF